MTRLAKRFKHPFLLESSGDGEYSFIGAEPFLTLKSKNGITEVAGEQNFKIKKDPLLVLRSLLTKYSIKRNIPCFYGGAVGYISYNYADTIEKLPCIANDDLSLPDVFFLLVDTVFVLNHKMGKLMLYALDDEKKELFLNQLKKPVTISPYCKNSRPVSNFTKSGFMKIVKKAKNYINNGDIYQVNLSQRLMVETSVEPLYVYKQLRGINPSPFSSYMDFGTFQIISSSPERLVKLKNGKISTRPIAGTRKRGDNLTLDDILKKELLHDEKERAEHIMLLDLARNDIGKVAKFGSVNVNELMTIEKYSHVQHLVSNVTGLINKDKDCIDLLQAMFPGGTITGAPKVRAMEIIEELEPIKRGPYTGSLGYIDFNGNIDFNILIRTILKKGKDAYAQAGAGIVYDSKPEKEYYETLYKAQAMLDALK